MNRKRSLVSEQENIEFFLNNNVDFENRVVYIDDINPIEVPVLIKAIKYMEIKYEDEPITFYISSYGGYIYEGMGLFDAIRTCKCPTITIGIGKVMSMGTMILCAGDVRKATKHTTFMFHELCGSTSGKFTDMKNEQKENERLMNLFSDIYAENSNKTKKWWKKALKNIDYFMEADEVKSLGIISEVI